MAVYGYIRTAQNEEFSKDQEDIIKLTASKNDLIIDKIYIDHNVSGLALGASFQEMMNTSNLKTGDTIITTSFSRISRKGEHIDTFLLETKNIGVRVISASEDFDTAIGRWAEFVSSITSFLPSYFGREFYLGDILSIVTDKILYPRKIEGMHDILNYMLGTQILTHQIPEAIKKCKPVILEQHPELATVDFSNIKEWGVWLRMQIELFGETLPIMPIPHINSDAQIHEID